MANLSVRGVEEKSLQRIKQAAKRQGVSVNRLIADLLNADVDRVAVPQQPTVHHDLDSLAGTWSAEDAREFIEAIASFEQIDEELWR